MDYHGGQGEKYFPWNGMGDGDCQTVIIIAFCPSNIYAINNICCYRDTEEEN